MYDERDSSTSTPKETMNGGKSPGWDWDALVPLVHPVRVQILEAMLWIGQPLSAANLARAFDGAPRLGVISYHMNRLAGRGILECVGTRRVRGATERFYWMARGAGRK